MSDQIALLPELTDAEQVTAPKPGRARRTDPPTSRQAAANAAVRSGTQRARVLAHLAAVGAHGATDYELSVACGIRRPHVAGTRRKELEEAGLVRRTGHTRPTDTGDEALVHLITEKGAAVVAELALLRVDS